MTTVAPAARPMPAVGAMLVSTASAVEAYAAWVSSPDEPADRQRLSDAARVAGETYGLAVVRPRRVGETIRRNGCPSGPSWP